MTVPRIKLGKLSGQIVIEKGRARFEGVRVHSADGDATLDGYVELHDPIGMSQMHAYLKFRPSEALIKREPTVELLINALAGTAKRSDGYLGIQLTGPLSAMFFLPSKDPPFGVTTRNEPAAAVAPDGAQRRADAAAAAAQPARRRRPPIQPPASPAPSAPSEAAAACRGPPPAPRRRRPPPSGAAAAAAAAERAGRRTAGQRHRDRPAADGRPSRAAAGDPQPRAAEPLEPTRPAKRRRSSGVTRALAPLRRRPPQLLRLDA